MWWWSYAWWWPGLALLVLAMVSCFVFMALMMRGSRRGMGSTGRMCGLGRWGWDGGDVNSILDERLAHGEIDVDEYRKLNAAVASAGTSGGSDD